MNKCLKSFVVLFMSIVGLSSVALAQASLPLSRTIWNAGEPTGWSQSGCTARTSTFACTGSNARTFSLDGVYTVVRFSTAPDLLTFKLKRAGMSGESKMVVEESADSTTWTLIGNYGTATGATVITDCADITFSLNTASRYVRWVYSKLGAGNCDLDDVSITPDAAIVANQLQFIPTPPTTGTSGIPFTITVCATDGTSTDVTYATPITVADNSSTATYTVTPTPSGTPTSGCVTFTVTPTSGGNVNLAFSSGAFPAVNTGNIAISVPALPMAGDCRTNWALPEPAGWTQGGCTQRATSFACTSTSARTFDTTGDSTVVNFTGVVGQVGFSLKIASMDSLSYMSVYESADGMAWTALDDFGKATNILGYTPIVDCDTVYLALNAASRYVKWKYTKSAGNCDLDDVCLIAATGCPVDLTKNENPIPAATYEASNSITSAGVVATGTTVVFNAGTLITLLPGFHATAGSTFTAQILGCTPFAPQAPAAKVAPKKAVETGLKTLDANIIPNPTYGDALVRYYVPTDGDVCITLHDLNGRSVVTLTNEKQLAGWQELPMQTSNLPKGLYFVHVRTSTETLTRKMIVLK